MSSRTPTELDKETFDNFITECNNYATLIGENEKLQKKEKKANQKIDKSLVKKPILTASEQKFFNNISKSFFKGAEKIVERITENFSFSEHMQKRVQQQIGSLILHTNDFFKTLPQSFNFSRMLKTAASWALNALIAYEAWQLAKKIASDNGLGAIFDDFLEPILAKIANMIKSAILPLTKKILSFITQAGSLLIKGLSFMVNAIDAMCTAINATTNAVDSQETALVMKVLSSIFSTVISFISFDRLWSMYLTILKLGGLNIFFSALSWLGITSSTSDETNPNVSDGNLDAYRHIFKNYQLTTTDDNRQQKTKERERTIATLESDAIKTLIRANDLGGGVDEDNLDTLVTEIRKGEKNIAENVGRFMYQGWTYDEASAALVKVAGKIVAKNPAKILSKEEYIEYIREYTPDILLKDSKGKTKEGNPTEEQLEKSYQAYRRYHEAQQILTEAKDDGAYGDFTVPKVFQDNIQTNIYEETETLFFGEYNTGNQAYKNFKRFTEGKYDEINEIQQIVVNFISNDFWQKISNLANRVKEQYFQREEETNEIQATTEDSRLLQNITTEEKEYNYIRPVAAEGTGNLSVVSRLLQERHEYLDKRLVVQQNLYQELSEKYELLVKSKGYKKGT